MTGETWLPIPGWEGRYDVSDQGRVQSWRAKGVKKPHVLSTGLDHGGYPQVTLFGGAGPRHPWRISTLVALTFIGPRPGGLEIRHLDGNRLNNTPSNLAYGTRSENALDAVAHGTHNSARKILCPQGHPYDEENTRFKADGRRTCAACAKDRRLRRIAADPGWLDRRNATARLVRQPLTPEQRARKTELQRLRRQRAVS